MASGNNIPREILESFRDVFDRRIKINIKRMVRQEVRTDKLENKILAFSPCRLFVLAAKVPVRQEQSFHFLDIQSIESRKPNQMVLNVDGKSFTFYTIDPDTEEIDHMITHIGKSLKQIFPAFPLERLIVKMDVVPPERLKTMFDMIRDIEGKEQGPCGGFTMMYACMCDYYNLTYRDEVAWDVDTIYLSQDTRELCLRDFDHLNGKDLVPIIAALEHNSWFTKLNANNVRLTQEAANEILKVMKRNAVIEELWLSNTGIKLDFIPKLSTALLSNSGTQLTRIDLSNNILEDRAVIHLMGSISNLSKGLVHLDLSKTGLTSKGLNKIVEIMSGSESIPAMLQTLVLADNCQKGEDLTNVYNFLAQSNVVTHLNLSSTDCALDMLSAALVRGCTCNLTSLKMAHTVFTHRKVKDVQVPQTWKQFFSSAFALQYIDLSSCRLPPEAVKDLFMGIASNRHMKAIELDISSNDLQTQGAHNIGGCLPDILNIASLDISNNGFDLDLKHLLRDITRNTNLKHLGIGRNFQGVKPKYIMNVLDPLVQVIQDEDSCLQSLSLAESKLKGDTAFVINALGSNTQLEHIDLSGNMMGDLGARMLGKALQINTKLRSVLWDKNGTTAQGFEDIADALEKNFTLRKMPFPVNDAAAAMKLQPERTELALQKIESLLQRNHSPCKFASDQAYRLQQGFLISSTQQMVDRLVVQVQDTVNALSMSPNDNFKESIECANNIIRDADNSKQLLPRLQDIAIKSQNSGNSTEVKLQEMSDNLRQVMEEQIQKTVSEMLACTKTQCSAVMGDKAFQTELNDGCLDRSSLPRDFTKLLLDGVGTDIFNKLGELNLAVAAHISDQVVDEVINTLTSSHRTLTNHLNLRKSGHYRDSELRDQSEKVDTETEKGSEETKNSATSPKPQSKRKSLTGRKRRPQSVIDRQHVHKAMQSSDTQLECKEAVAVNDAVVVDVGAQGEGFAHVNHVEKLDKVDEGKEKDVIDDLDDLDALEMPHIPKLEHVTKARPKRVKRVAATRPVANTVTVDEAAEDDGLNVFFAGKPSSDDLSTSKKKEITHTQNVKSEKPESSKPEPKKRWFGKDKDTKDKPVAKETKEKEAKKDKPSGIGAGLSNFFARRSGGKSGEFSRERKHESELEKTEEQLPGKTDSLKGKVDLKSADVKTKENKEESKVKVADEKDEVSEESEEENDEGPGANNDEEGVKEKVMPKIPRIGLGGNVMAELKLKHDKRLSQIIPPPVKTSPPEVKTSPPQVKSSPTQVKSSPTQVKTSPPQVKRPPPPVTSPPQVKSSPAQVKSSPPQVKKSPVPVKKSPVTPEKEKVETNNNVVDKESEVKEKVAPRKALLPPSRASTLPHSSPVPQPREAISPKRHTVNSSNIEKEQQPEVKLTPPPVLKPKPPVLKPKPRNSLRASKENPDEAGVPSSAKQKDLSTDKKPKDKKSDSEIVYDSATLRLTVKEKIKRLSKTFKEDDVPVVGGSPIVKKKTALLPRNIEETVETETSDDSLEERKSESVDSITDDGEKNGEKNEDDKSIQSQSKSSGESTPDSADGQSSSDIEEDNDKSSPVPIDEIMV